MLPLFDRFDPMYDAANDCNWIEPHLRQVASVIAAGTIPPPPL